MVDYLDYLDDVLPLAKLGSYLPKVVGSLFGPSEPPASAKQKESHPLKPAWEEIVQVAGRIVGDDKQAVEWLYEPKMAFGNRAPLEMFGTKAGCDAVMELLHKLWT